ncbi:MAG: GTPase Era [Bacteroidales bacterium]|nr:GTPase Era [Bacteroidales bacterium]MCL2132724.1 GTPase Era [Bacteroidales bacterium]
MHKSGFVNIIGNPNVGKSTLMNALVGEKLSIITAKAQTTRHRIMGIVNGEDFQVVFSDTPGILRPNYKLQESMMKFVNTAIGDADLILYVTDVVEKYDKNEEYITRLQQIDTPVILVINKIDLTTPEALERLVEVWTTLLPKAIIYPVSAQEKFNIDGVFKRILSFLPESPAYYDKDALTDRNLRFFAAEIIREKILLNYSKEIPYCTEATIEQFRETEDMYHIEAVIHVARNSQKGIIIGSGGSALKRISIQARRDMEDFFEKKVYLRIFVKVNPDWRENTQQLKNFGYILE